MGLKEYIKKRKFNETPEPKGKVEKRRGKLRFVIQKHQATRLHYDLRLEMDGVMPSWAVPKGPSLDPKDKRLAMMTEDHPLDYRTFEGTIPEGNYGAGDVIVWDEGTYEPENGDPRTAVEKGEFKFNLHGKKVNGSFALVKMNGRESNAWLLVKHKDKYASTKDVTKDQKSVRSSLSLGDEPHSKVYMAKGRDPMPKNVKPMLATLVKEPFDREGWIYEIKWDGYRTVAEIEVKRGKAEVNLHSRNNISFNQKYPKVVQALERLQQNMILDGEVVVVDEQGRSNFQHLQDYALQGRGKLVYFVFDLLYINGRDLRQLPLTERKELLKKALPRSGTIKYSDHIEEKGLAFFRQADKQGLEGIIAKNGRSLYYAGRRSEEWLKIKTHRRQEAIICGFTEPRNSRKLFGAIILGVYNEKKELVYIGHTGTGFSDAGLKDTYNKLRPLIVREPPFKVKPRTNMPATWVKPKLVCEIEFSEWTGDGRMRHPSFQGLREDKKPGEVTREKEKSV